MNFFGKKLSEAELDDAAAKVLLQLAPRPKVVLSPIETSKANRQEKFESMVVNALAEESKGAVAGESESEEEGAFQKIPKTKTAKQLREEEKQLREQLREKAKQLRAVDRDAARVNAGKKREDEREKRKVETQALTAQLVKPYDDFNFDFKNMGIGAEEEEEEAEQAEPHDVNDMMKEEEERLEEMTIEEIAAYKEKKEMEEIVKEFEREQIDILNESRKEDLARKNQDISDGIDSGFKRSEVEKNRQRFAKSANAKPFFERMEGDDDKFGGKKRTMRRKNKKGTRMAMARRTRQRKTRTRTRTMRKKARKSRKSKSRKSRK